MEKGQLELLKKMYLGTKVHVIIKDQYHPIDGEGTVVYVDDMGHLHGTWGSLSAIIGEDEIEVI